MGPNPPVKRVRSDADRNRRTILAKAGEVFQEQGLRASLAEIAARAELGIGTLYRHFAGRDELVRAIIADDLADLLVLADKALQISDAWQALEEFCFTQTAQGAERRVIRELVVLHDFGPTTGVGSELLGRIDALTANALRAGYLRPDVTAQDVVLILTSMARVLEVTSDSAPKQWRRTLTLALDGLRADGRRSPLTEPSISQHELEHGLARVATTRIDQAKRRPKDYHDGRSGDTNEHS